jgi:hypothetical protein
MHPAALELSQDWCRSTGTLACAGFEEPETGAQYWILIPQLASVFRSIAFSRSNFRSGPFVE